MTTQQLHLFNILFLFVVAGLVLLRQVRFGLYDHSLAASPYQRRPDEL